MAILNSMQAFKGKNRIIEKLIEEGIFSYANLKHLYRQLCKATHPDLTRGGEDDFIRLQEEYRQAITFLEEKGQVASSRAQEKVSYPGNPEKQFYRALQYYTLSGLHSMRVRNKKALRSRNLRITRDVIFWANWYDPSFIPIFLRYNRIFLRPLAGRDLEQRLKKARVLFLDALSWLFKFKLENLKAAGRASESYLNDALFMLGGIDPRYYRGALLEFALWVKAELRRNPGDLN